MITSADVIRLRELVERGSFRPSAGRTIEFHATHCPFGGGVTLLPGRMPGIWRTAQRLARTRGAMLERAERAAHAPITAEEMELRCPIHFGQFYSFPFSWRYRRDAASAWRGANGTHEKGYWDAEATITSRYRRSIAKQLAALNR